MVHPNEPDSRGISLSWNIGSFFPLPDAYRDRTVREWLNPEAFDDFNQDPELSDFHVENSECWCIAAKMMDTRLALMSFNLIPNVREASEGADYLRMEMDLNLIAAKIGVYSTILTTITDAALYWDSYKEIIEKCADNKPYIKTEISHAVSAFLELSCPLEDKDTFKSARKAAEDYQKTGDSGHEKEFVRDAKKYLTKVLDINNKNNLLKKLSALLNKNLQNKNSGVKTITPQQCKELRVLLQKKADQITAIINSVDGNAADWRTEMETNIRKIRDFFNVSQSNGIKYHLNRHTGEKGGCIAVLKIQTAQDNKEHYYLTQSDFSDLETAAVLLDVKPKVSILCHRNCMDRVCKTLSEVHNCDICYVPYEEAMMEHVQRYEVESHIEENNRWYEKYQYSDKVRSTFKQDYDALKAGSDYLKKECELNYACCERKILAYLKVHNIKAMSGFAEWYIKYYPCIQCSRAIDLWRKENKIQRLTFLHPVLSK